MNQILQGLTSLQVGYKFLSFGQALLLKICLFFTRASSVKLNIFFLLLSFVLLKCHSAMKLWLRIPLVKSDGDSQDANSEGLVSRWIKDDANLRL